MAINFRYRDRNSGRKFAEVAVTFTVDRSDLVKAALTIAGDWLDEEYGYSDKADYITNAESVSKAFDRVSKVLVEREVRECCLTHGLIWQESGDSDWGRSQFFEWGCPGELLDACRTAAEATVTRLYPETY